MPSLYTPPAAVFRDIVLQDDPVVHVECPAIILNNARAEIQKRSAVKRQRARHARGTENQHGVRVKVDFTNIEHAVILIAPGPAAHDDIITAIADDRHASVHIHPLSCIGSCDYVVRNHRYGSRSRSDRPHRLRQTFIVIGDRGALHDHITGGRRRRDTGEQAQNRYSRNNSKRGPHSHTPLQHRSDLQNGLGEIVQSPAESAPCRFTILFILLLRVQCVNNHETNLRRIFRPPFHFFLLMSIGKCL